MRKIYFLFLFIVLIYLDAAAQKPPLQLNWLNTAQMYDNGGYFAAEAVADLSDGSVVAAGNFSNTVDFDPGPDTFNIKAASGSNIFIAKYSNHGKLIFAYAFGDTISQVFQSAYGVAIDADDNIYVTGTFSGNVDFDAGAGKTILSSAATTTNNFLACFTKNGKLKFAKNITASRDMHKQQNANAVTIDKNKNIYVTGYFFGSLVDFDPGPNNTALRSQANDIFFAKYDSLGNFLFVKNISGTGDDMSYKIATDTKNNILICGAFNSPTIDFGSLNAPHVLSLKGRIDLFFAKYDSLGNYIFAKNIGSGTNNNYAAAIAIGTDNHFVITGNFAGKYVDFDPGNDSTHLLSTNGYHDAFIAKYNSNGDCDFAFTIGSKDYEAGRDITLDKNNNIICIGNLSNSNTDFDPGPDSFFIKKATYNYTYIAKYTYSGSFVFAEAIGNYYENLYGSCIINDLHVTQTNKILLAGSYNQSLDVDAGQGSTIISTPSPTMFIDKFDNNGKFLNVISGNNYFNYYNANTITTASATDKKGNVYTCGYFNGKYDVDKSSGSYIIESLADYNYSSYFIKYNKEGKLVFAKTLIGGGVIIRDIAVDDNENIYLSGLGSTNTDFDPADSVQHLDNGDSTGKKTTGGYFFAKYNADGNLVFAKGEGSKNFYIEINSVAIDKNKNIAIAGRFDHNLDLDTGPNEYILNANYYGDCFFAKYDSLGNFILAECLKSATSSSGEIYDLQFNNKNDIIVTGNFNGDNVDFDAGAGNTLLSSGPNNYSYAGFIATYSYNGAFKNVVRIGGEQDYNESVFYSLTTDAANNIYIAGESSGKVDFDPGIKKAFLPELANMCFASYTASGKFRFLKGISEYTPSLGLGNQLMSLSLDKNNNIYVAGQFGSIDIDCDPGPDSALLVNEYYDQYNNLNTDLFIAKYDSAGKYIFSYDFDGDSAVGFNQSTSIMVDDKGNINYSGWAKTKINFSTNSHAVYLQPTSNYYNIFIAQYKPTITQNKIVNIASASKTISNNAVKIYPNPITDKLNIQLNNINQNNATAIIYLFDVNGKCVQTNQASFINHNLNTTIKLPQNLSTGNYFIKIDIEGKTYYSDALIK